MKKFITITSLIMVSLLAGSPSDAKPDSAMEALLKSCPGFSEKNMGDPNIPCQEAIREDINEKETVGLAFDRNITGKTSSTMDESGGSHVRTALTPSDESNQNIYQEPFLRSSVGSGSGTSPGASEEAGATK